MRLIRHLCGIVLAAYWCHFTYLLTSRLSNGYSQMAAYTLGVIFAFPGIHLVHQDLEDIKDTKTRLAASYFLGFLAFGAGTGIGWQLHPMDPPHVHMMDDQGIR
jgi:hypothetical protein